MSAAAAEQVCVRREPVVLPTYAPCAADLHPMFIEKRVYQGSSGKVYPLPFVDRVEEERREQSWDGVWLENEHVRLLVLPQLGGRIHVGQVRGRCSAGSRSAAWPAHHSSRPPRSQPARLAPEPALPPNTRIATPHAHCAAPSQHKAGATGYDFFYRQRVVKPALVGLAGPWISGGVEFNWCGCCHLERR